MAIKIQNMKNRISGPLCIFSGLLLVLAFFTLSACSSSSDTRTQAKAASEAGTYNVVAKITTPLDGSTIAFDTASATNTTFLVVGTGGSGTYSSYTVNVKGPTTESTSSGTSGTITITFFEVGEHTLTATVTDNTGKTGTDSIKVNVVQQTASNISDLSANIVSPIITTYDVNTAVAFTGNAKDGSATYSSYAWTVTGPAATQPDKVFGTAATTATFTFVAVGEYVVKLTVQDDLGAQASETMTITIK